MYTCTYIYDFNNMKTHTQKNYLLCINVRCMYMYINKYVSRLLCVAKTKREKNKHHRWWNNIFFMRMLEKKEKQRSLHRENERETQKHEEKKKNERKKNC